MKIKKLFNIMLMTIVAISISINISEAAISKKMTADVGTKRIPQGTILKMRLIDPIDSSTMKIGDEVDFMVTEDIKVEKKVVLPVGSVIRSSVQRVEPSKMLSKGASIYIDFDHVVSTTGKQVPIKAGFCQNRFLSYDGGLSSKTNYGTATVETAHTTAKIVTVSTKWGWETGNQVLEGYPKYVLAPVSAVVSTPVAGVYFFGNSIYNIFKKGDNVLVNQGETINLMLIKPLDMPIY